MKMRHATALALATALIGPAAASGRTDIESDEKRAGKVAIPNSSLPDPKPKGYCVCLVDGTADSVNGLGILTFGRAPVTLGEKIEVLCRVYQYDTMTGERVASDTCEAWVPLAK